MATSIVGLKKNGHIRKNLTKYGKPQRSSWEPQKKKKGAGQSRNSNSEQCELEPSMFGTVVARGLNGQALEFCF